LAVTPFDQIKELGSEGTVDDYCPEAYNDFYSFKA
jgi:hypothetical protein